MNHTPPERRPTEPPIAVRPERILVLALGALLLVGALLLLTRVPAVSTTARRVDEAANAAMIDHEVGALVAGAHVLALIGSVWVTAPLRVAIGVLLVVRRWWWRLGAWVGSIALMEAGVTALKGGYGRARPAGALEVARSASFPSGHAAAAAVTVVTLLLLLTSPGRARRRGTIAAATVIVLMAGSRVVLRVHWVSDVVVGAAIGVAAALVAVGVAALAQRRVTRQHHDDALSRRREG
jgi:membrane-associated phospholipid phosphatase